MFNDTPAQKTDRLLGVRKRSYLITDTHILSTVIYISKRNIYKEPCDSVMGTKLKQAVCQWGALYYWATVLIL